MNIQFKIQQQSYDTIKEIKLKQGRKDSLKKNIDRVEALIEQRINEFCKERCITIDNFFVTVEISINDGKIVTRTRIFLITFGTEFIELIFDTFGNSFTFNFARADLYTFERSL